MRVTLKQAFSILDGRLSTSMEDVKEMMDYIFSDKLCTDQLPVARRNLQEANPAWYANGVKTIEAIKQNYHTDDFNELMDVIDKDFYAYEIDLEKIAANFKFTGFSLN